MILARRFCQNHCPIIAKLLPVNSYLLRSIIFGLILISIGTNNALGQEVDREKSKTEMSPEEKARKEANEEAILHGKKTPIDNAADYLMRGEPIRFGPTHKIVPFDSISYASFADVSGDSWKLKTLSKSVSRELTGSRLSLRGLDVLFDVIPPENLIVFTDSIPDFAATWITKCRRCVILTDKTRYKNKEDLTAAAGLAFRPLKASNTILFNGLPFETRGQSSTSELSRMKVANDRDGWLRERKTIETSAEEIGVPAIRATKPALLDELKSGNKDVIFVIAHSDSQSIYLPGSDGDKISIRELRSLKRDNTPDRIVVLLVCEGGSVNERTSSMAEILLQNNLAKSVLATPDLVDARGIAAMLRQLRDPATHIKSAFTNLWQLVLKSAPNDDSSRLTHFVEIS
jgi:hypothetical protein